MDTKPKIPNRVQFESTVFHPPLEVSTPDVITIDATHSDYAPKLPPRKPAEGPFNRKQRRALRSKRLK